MKNENETLLPFKIPVFLIAGVAYFILKGFSGKGIDSIQSIVFFMFVFFTVINGKNRVKKTRSREEVKLKTCGSCQSEMPENDQICPVCGVDSSITIECDYCGHENNPASIICEKCNGLIA